MKKFIYCILAVLTCLICFTACGGSGENSSSASQGSSIEFVQNEITISVGDSVQAEVVTSKKNVFILWSVRDTQIASVSTDGVITALQEGQTICYARFGNETAMCLVKITAKSATPLLSVSVPYEGGSATLYVGDTLDLRACVKLGDDVIDGAQIEYQTLASDIVRVENGQVEALKAGSDTITILVSYEGQTAKATLTVSVVE